MGPFCKGYADGGMGSVGIQGGFGVKGDYESDIIGSAILRRASDAFFRLAATRGTGNREQGTDREWCQASDGRARRGAGA